MESKTAVKKTIRELEQCFDDSVVAVVPTDTVREAIALLKAQEPNVITKDEFKNNPNVDENGYLPAYCEKIDRPIGWMAIHKGYIGARKDIRYWTGKPTDEQLEAVKWE